MAALDALLKAAIEHDGRRPRATPALVWHGDVEATPFVYRDPKGIPTRRQSEMTALLDDPVGAALRSAVRRIGEHLFALSGDTSLMHEVIDRVAEIDPSREGWRGSIVDHAWNGIGSGEDRWWS